MVGGFRLSFRRELRAFRGKHYFAELLVSAGGFGPDGHASEFVVTESTIVYVKCVVALSVQEGTGHGDQCHAHTLGRGGESVAQVCPLRDDTASDSRLEPGSAYKKKNLRGTRADASAAHSPRSAEVGRKPFVAIVQEMYLEENCKKLAVLW